MGVRRHAHAASVVFEKLEDGMTICEVMFQMETNDASPPRLPYWLLPRVFGWRTARGHLVREAAPFTSIRCGVGSTSRLT
jgi:hypothetical protein